MSKEQKKLIVKLKQKGLIENKDFRVVYFNTQAEVKIKTKLAR